jgi:hypothetical protein
VVQVIGLIAFNLIAAILPASGTFVPDEEVEERPKGALQDPTISILDPKRFFGTSGFGFTKENELFVGRVAQLGFAASLIGETITGKGPLAQFDIETGINLLVSMRCLCTCYPSEGWDNACTDCTLTLRLSPPVICLDQTWNVRIQPSSAFLFEPGSRTWFRVLTDRSEYLFE